MKKITVLYVVSIVVLAIGIIVYLGDGYWGWFSTTDAGFIALGVGFPLIALGLLSLVLTGVTQFFSKKD